MFLLPIIGTNIEKERLDIKDCRPMTVKWNVLRQKIEGYLIIDWPFVLFTPNNMQSAITFFFFLKIFISFHQTFRSLIIFKIRSCHLKGKFIYEIIYLKTSCKIKIKPTRGRKDKELPKSRRIVLNKLKSPSRGIFQNWR